MKKIGGGIAFHGTVGTWGRDHQGPVPEQNPGFDGFHITGARFGDLQIEGVKHNGTEPSLAVIGIGSDSGICAVIITAGEQIVRKVVPPNGGIPGLTDGGPTG